MDGANIPDAYSSIPKISNDGNKILFTSDKPLTYRDAIDDSNNGRDQDLFIYDVALQELTRINENADGNRIDTNGSAFSADLSGDGRFVSFNAMNEWGTSGLAFRA